MIVGNGIKQTFVIFAATNAILIKIFQRTNFEISAFSK